MHRDKALYRNARLRSRRTTLVEEDVHLLSEINRMEGEIYPARPISGICEQLYGLLREHSNFDQISRVCIVETVGLSNQLMVLDSFVPKDVAENLMVPGYRCFVAAEGSLFKLKDGEMRILPDVSKVIASFTNDNKPVQRSMARVHAMGFKSGLCLPIEILGRRGGYVFLNSKEPFYFNLARNQDYLLYNNITNLAKTAVAAHTNQAGVMDETGSVYKWEAERFDDTAFADHLETILAYRHRLEKKCHVHLTSDQDPFLVAYSTLATFWADLCIHLHLYSCDREFEFQVEVKNQEVLMRFNLEEILDPKLVPFLSVHLSEPSKTAVQNGWTFYFDRREARISFPYDRACDLEHVLYSV